MTIYSTIEEFILDILDTSNFLSLIILFILTYIVQFYFRYFTRPNKIPGPIPFPLIGNIESYRPNASQWANELRKKHGDIFEVYGLFSLTRQIWVSNANLTNKLLNPSYTQNNFPYRTTENEGLDKMDMINKGIVYNRNVKTWEYNRRIVTRALMSPKFLKKAAVLKLITNTKSYTLFNYFKTLNILNEDEKENINNDLIKESEKFVNYFRLHFVACLFFKDTPKLLRTILPANRKKSKELLDVVAWLNNKVLELIRQRKKEIESAELDEELSADMLTLLLTINTNRDPKYSNEEDARPMSELDVRENVYEVMGGGIDTVC